MGITQFSAFLRLRIALNTHGNRDTIISALGNFQSRPRQIVNIGAALNFVQENMLYCLRGQPYSAGSTPLLLKCAMTVWKNLQQLMGVLIQAAGSKAADKQELKQIAFPDSIVFMTKDFRLLLRKPPKILHALSYLAP